ncbi:MAG: hypothetical protein ACT4PV_12040 [Planctomycetaceae bacterium]
MSDRGLLGIAALLLALITAILALAADRLNLLAPPAPPPVLLFVNATLAAKPRESFDLVPQDRKQPVLRYIVDHLEAEPGSPMDPGTLHPFPHVVLGVGIRSLEDSDFAPHKLGGLPLANLGAITAAEWLEGIRMVREKRPDGSEGVVLEAVYGHPQGGQRVYVHDPAHPTPVLGWFRLEIRNAGAGPEIYFVRPLN